MPFLSLTYWEINMLLQLMIDKWATETKPSPARKKSFTGIIGYSTGSQENKPSNFTSLCQHINETSDTPETTVTPHYLYNLRPTLEGVTRDPDSIIQLDERYARLFFRYLGYEDFEAFRLEHYETVEYTGLYWSNTRQEIRPYEFSISIPPYREEMLYPRRVFATSSKFHDNEITLSGEIRHFKNCWIAHVTNGEYYLDLSVYTRTIIADPQKLLAFNQLFGTLSTISNSGHLISAETVLIRNGLAQDTRLVIEQYLNVRRNYFGIYITEEDQRSVEALKTGEIPINAIQHLTRTFRILAQGTRGYAQARFTIKNDYTAEISVPDVEKGQPLPCRLLVDNVDRGTLLVYSYLRRQANRIYTATAIEFVHGLKESQILQGAYFVVAQQYAPVAGFKFAIMRDNTPFAIERYSNEAARGWTDGDPRKKLLEKLQSS